VSSEHIVLGPVRDYLLGKLGEPACTELEEKYFIDRTFFLQVQAVEFALIESYFRGQLSPADRRLFEGRYLVVPELRKRLEEVRRRKGYAMPEAPGPRTVSAFGWRWATAAAAVLLIGAGVWTYRGARPAPPSPPGTGAPAAQLPVIGMRLSPGVLMGSDAGGAVLVAPATPSVLRLTLEFPGRTTELAASAHISIVGEHGERVPVWQSAKPVMTVPAAGGQIAAFDVPTILLPRGDYVVEAGDANGQVKETYIFRATPAKP
jgi:hypothetical protein